MMPVDDLGIDNWGGPARSDELSISSYDRDSPVVRVSVSRRADSTS